MNKKYQLHQIHLTDDEFNKVNAEGHNSVEKHKLHIEMSLSDKINSICKQAWDKGYYTHVANVSTADGLEGVFRTSNIGPDDNIERISNMYSAKGLQKYKRVKYFLFFHHDYINKEKF